MMEGYCLHRAGMPFKTPQASATSRTHFDEPVEKATTRTHYTVPVHSQSAYPIAMGVLDFFSLVIVHLVTETSCLYHS